MFPSPDPTQLLLGHLPDTTERQFKDARNRLGALVTWLENTGGDVLQPNLAAYLWYLLQDRKLAPATAKAHLYSIRARYRTLQEEDVIREHLHQRFSVYADPTEAALAVAEALRYLDDALDFSLEDLKPKRTPDDYLRLTAEQIFSLLHKPDPHTHSGRRDRAVLALLFTAGLRKTELVRLQVKDLHFWIDDDELALHVPKCRACVERLVGGFSGGCNTVTGFVTASTGRHPCKRETTAAASSSRTARKGQPPPPRPGRPSRDRGLPHQARAGS